MRKVEQDSEGLVGALIEDERWRGIDIEQLANRACVATIKQVGRDPDTLEIGLLACDDQRIEELNSRFRNLKMPTNVLAWPARENAGAPVANLKFEERELENLGDIAISWDTCVAEADDAGRPLDDHVTHLVVHGCLHLLGYRHNCDRDAEEMERLETDVLASLGASGPFGSEVKQFAD